MAINWLLISRSSSVAVREACSQRSKSSVSTRVSSSGLGSDAPLLSGDSSKARANTASLNTSLAPKLSKVFMSPKTCCCSLLDVTWSVAACKPSEVRRNRSRCSSGSTPWAKCLSLARQRASPLQFDGPLVVPAAKRWWVWSALTIPSEAT